MKNAKTAEKGTQKVPEKRMFSTKEAAEYIGMGINRTREFLSEIGAARRIGRRVVFDRVVIDSYFDNLAAEQTAQ